MYQFPRVHRQENSSFVPMKYRDVSGLENVQFCGLAVHCIVFLFLSFCSKFFTVALSFYACAQLIIPTQIYSLSSKISGQKNLLFFVKADDKNPGKKTSTNLISSIFEACPSG